MRIRDRIFRIGTGILCVIMAALLIVLMFMNHRRNQERADALRQKTEERKVLETQKIEKAAELYDHYIDQLGGISVVCWGDAVMAGKGDASLPSALGAVIGENLYQPFTESYSKIVDKEEMTQPDAVVANMGVRDEGMREILVRAGVNTMKVGEWALIPGDTEPQNIVLGDDTFWTPLHFARQDKVSFGKVVIEEIEGTLIEGEGEYDELHPRFAFVRDEEGDSFQTGAGTVIETENASRYLGDIPVFFFEDDSADNVDSFMSDLEDLVDRYTDYYHENREEEETSDEDTLEEQSEDGYTGDEQAAEEESGGAEEGSEKETSVSHAFVVLCTVESDSDLDTALKEEFGDHYIRSDLYADSLNADNCKNLAQKVYEALDAQGCFDTVKEITAQAIEALDDLSVQVEH